MLKDQETVGVFIAEEVNRIGDTGPGYPKTVNVKTPSETFWKDFLTWNCFPQLQKYQDFQYMSFMIKEILLYSSNIC
jgi:hypothetical protein